jgi:hypothetical protein
MLKTPPLLAAIELATPLFLLGCLAMAIPLVLHLLARQRAPERPFSTLRFLKKSVSKTARRRRLRDVLLLALRMAFCGLLALALARPLLTGLARYGRHSTAVAIVLDNSQSMSLADGGESRFERAKNLALEIVDRLQDGDEVALVLTSGPSRHQLDLYRQFENVSHLIETSQVCLSAADVPATVKAAQGLLEHSQAPNRQIFLITDMQASGFRALPARDDQGKRMLTDLPLVVLDVHRGRPQNLAIESVDVHGTLPGVGLPLSVKAGLRNGGTSPQEAQVELAIDGQVVQRAAVLRLAAGESQFVAFDYTPANAGIPAACRLWATTPRCSTTRQPLSSIHSPPCRSGWSITVMQPNRRIAAPAIISNGRCGRRRQAPTRSRSARCGRSSWEPSRSVRLRRYGASTCAPQTNRPSPPCASM